MLWKWSCGRRITDLINSSFPKTSNSSSVTGKEPNHISRSQSSGNTRKLINPRKSTSPKALEVQSSYRCSHLLIHPFNNISSQTFQSLDHFPRLQMTRKPQELHRSCDGSNSWLHFGFWCQQTEILWLWKASPADSQIFIHGCCGNIHQGSWCVFSKLPTLKRRWWSQHSYFLRPTGQEIPVPPRPQYPPGFLLRYCWWYSSA